MEGPGPRRLPAHCWTPQADSEGPIGQAAAGLAASLSPRINARSAGGEGGARLACWGAITRRLALAVAVGRHHPSTEPRWLHAGGGVFGGAELAFAQGHGAGPLAPRSPQSPGTPGRGAGALSGAGRVCHVGRGHRGGSRAAGHTVYGLEPRVSPLFPAGHPGCDERVCSHWQQHPGAWAVLRCAAVRKRHAFEQHHRCRDVQGGL